MKKLFIMILLLFTFTLISFNVYGATETIQYDLTFYNNKQWDVADGIFKDNINYQSTNRLRIYEDEITLSTINFHHILFWRQNGSYIGYYNTSNTSYQNAFYLDDTDATVDAPVDAYWFSLTADKLGAERVVSELEDDTYLEFFEGRTIPALNNLIMNGDGSTTTGWSAVNSTNSVSGGSLINTLTGSSAFGYPSQVISFPANNIYYFKVRARVTNSLSTRIRVGNGGFIGAYIDQNTPVQNQWYIISGARTQTTNQSGFLIIQDYANTTDATGAVMEVDYALAFNLTASHGVTATTGTAYDNAVADIEAFLTLNDGYFGGSLFNWIKWGRDNGYSYNEMLAFYNDYQYFSQWDAISTLLFYGIEASYDREEIEQDERSWFEKVDDWMDDLAVGVKFLIAVAIIGATVIGLAVKGATGVVLMLISLLWYIVFSIVGWFGTGLVIIFGVILFGLIALRIFGGGNNG